MKSDEQIIRQFKKHKGVSNKGLSKQMTNTQDCQAFYSGDFMNYTDRLQFADGRGNKKATMVQFNKVKPYVNAVRGFMAQNRRKAEYTAQISEDQGEQMFSKYANALKDDVRAKANADQIETQQDGDMLICGYGAIETALTYGEGHASRNPNGEIGMMRLDPRSLGWDASARATNLMDSRWVFYKEIYALDDAKELFDDSEDQDFEAESSGGGEGNKVYYKRGGAYNKISELYDWEDEDENLVKIYFYQWYEIETFYRAKNPIGGMQDPILKQFTDMRLQEIAQEQEQKQVEDHGAVDDTFAFDPRANILSCDDDVKGKLEELFEDAIEFDDYKRKVFYTAVISGKKVFTKYRNSCQQGFSVKFKTGDYDESNKMWVGMVNSLRDPAMYFNKALTELLFTIASNAKGGVMIERGAVEDIQDFEAKWAKTDTVIEVEEGALSGPGGSKIQPKRQPYTPTGAEQIIQIANDAMPDVSGIDKGFLGSSENKVEPAALQRQRIRQVTTTLATYFDAITLYQKEHTELLMPLMRILAENNDGSMFRAFGADGTNMLLTISPANFADGYFVSVNEAPITATQKEEQNAALMNVYTNIVQANPQDPAAKAVLAIIVKNMPIDYVDRQQIIQALMPQGPHIDPAYVQQLQAEIKKLMDDGQTAEIAERLARAHDMTMAGQLKISQIKKNNAEIGKINAETGQTKVETSVVQRDTGAKDTDVNINA